MCFLQAKTSVVWLLRAYSISTKHNSTGGPDCQAAPAHLGAPLKQVALLAGVVGAWQLQGGSGIALRRVT